MAHIQPFKALRPDAAAAARVASRPYDVMDRAEAKAEARGNPDSFLHITRSEIDLPDSVSPYDDSVYQTAKSNLKAFFSRGILFREDKACYYIYRLTMNGRSQTGIVCVSSVEDYHNDVIKKHEFTRPEKETDRIRHIVGTGAQTGNVFLAYRDVAEINALVSEWQLKRSPVYEFTADDGIKHEVWVVNTDKAVGELTRLFGENVPATYIADGHHRAASAAKAQMLFKKETSRQKAGWFLTTLFPASELYIMDYNRLAKDLNGLSHEEFFHQLAEHFEISLEGKDPFAPAQLHDIGMYIDGNWYRLRARPGSYSDDPIGVLDVSILQNKVLDHILAIKDPRTDPRIDFAGGIRGLEYLQQRVDDGKARVAFSLYPVSIQQLFDIADHGSVMPPKSTWFEPKLRDGLLTNLIEK
ncbi:MAG TPA: DUF1015 family protein [Phnomibacter sp.]|nr:DUF1015 family protein [Phnomibacter sp.]